MATESEIPWRTRVCQVTALAVCLAVGFLVIIDGKRLPISSQNRPTDAANKTRATIQARLASSYGRLPLSFEMNRGQTDARVKFLSRGRGYTLFLTRNEAVLALKKSSVVSAQSSVLRVRVVGANPQAKVIGLDELPGKSNYFIGNDPRKWRTNVPTYAKVEYQNVYPGIDLLYYGNQGGQLEYDFVVRPGGDPRSIQFAVTSEAQEDIRQKAVGSVAQAPNASFEAQSPIANRKSSITAPLRIDPDGDLVIATDTGDVRFHKPAVYQEPFTVQTVQVRGQDEIRNWKLEARHSRNLKSPIANRKSVEARFVLTASIRVGFEIPTYDKTKPLVIDPTLAYSTFLGGRYSDAGSSIAVDASGDAYILGETSSSDFPVSAGAFQATLAGTGGDGFVSKLNADGSALLYANYLGGSTGTFHSRGITIDASGNAYLVGDTNQSDFPTTAGAFLATFNGAGSNAVVTKLNATGSALVYSTYLGGAGDTSADLGGGIAVDASGNAYVTGTACGASDFPVTPGAFQTTFIIGPYCHAVMPL